MPILLKRKNGEITPFRNAEYISAFYFIPKSILDKCGEEINSIPRNPRKLLQDRRGIEIIESDLFKLVIIDAYAFMVWPFMGLGAKREIYSGYEPSWRYAHAASIWIKGMEDEGVIPKSQEILKSSNVYEDIGYISEEEISETFTWLVPKIMAKHNMNEIIAVAAEYRCFEDFDYRKSRQKIDFYRKWYHTRAKISVESLDEIKEKYAENTDGMEWDIPDDNVNVESMVLEPIAVSKFLDTLSETDRKILTMRMDDVTLEKIAEELGFKTHSAIHKRIRKIGLAYEKFSGEDLGFSNKKIIEQHLLMYKSVGVLFMCGSRKEVFLVQYNLIKSQQIKIKNTLCMQCVHQSCLMISSGVCPVFAKANPKIIKIKEDNHNEKI